MQKLTVQIVASSAGAVKYGKLPRCCEYTLFLIFTTQLLGKIGKTEQIIGGL
jgi:hypothetical protein